MPKVMPKFIFMGGVALFALRRVVVVRIDGGESLLAEALSVALCWEPYFEFRFVPFRHIPLICAT